MKNITGAVYKDGKFYVDGEEANCIECLCSERGQNMIYQRYQDEQVLAEDFSFLRPAAGGISEEGWRLLHMRSMVSSYVLRRFMADVRKGGSEVFDRTL